MQVRKDIEEVCERLNELRPLGLKTLAMTTNGIKLKDKLPKIKLDLLNVSLDTLVPAKVVFFGNVMFFLPEFSLSL